jgi:SAM-dependent methyltransferase
MPILAGIKIISEVKQMQYSLMSEYYDKLYSFKDYGQEVIDLLDVIRQYIKYDFNTLLDVACGTGKHLEELKKYFECEGLDINFELLEIAKVRNPELRYHQADMLDFTLEKQFDIITCFFGSIGHVKTIDNLEMTIRNLKRHLTPKGILAIEPWHTPEQFKAGRTSLLTVDEPDLKIARCCSSQVEGNLSILDLHHLICVPDGTKHFIEQLELGLFREQDYLDCLSEGGYTVVHEKIRSNGNGVYLVFKR